MDISKIVSGGLQTGGVNAGREQQAAANRQQVERQSPPAESVRVQLSAQGQAKSASAQAETEASRLRNERNGENAAAAKAQEQRAKQPQQGFSFNGAAAYSRVFSS